VTDAVGAVDPLDEAGREAVLETEKELLGLGAMVKDADDE
jgi:hypothetical protein